MSKTVYGIYLDRPNDDQWRVIKEEWSNCYVHNQHIGFITDESNKLTEDIANMAGIGPNTSGFVFQMDFYSGHTTTSFVEWLKKNS